jgi:hypothetical protein
MPVRRSWFVQIVRASYFAGPEREDHNDVRSFTEDECSRTGRKQVRSIVGERLHVLVSHAGIPVAGGSKL